MQKTLLLTEIFPPKTGGSGRWFWEIYRRLPRDQVVVAAGVDARQEEFDGTHDLDVHRTPLSWGHWDVFSIGGAKGYWAAYRNVRRLVKQNNIDQIHCGTILTEGLVAWLVKKRMGIPYTTYVHGEELNIGLGSRELGMLMRRVLRDATCVVANSQNTSSLLENGWDVPKERIQILNPGVDIERFVPVERSAEARAGLGWHDRPVVLTVGRLQKRKGHDMLIRAIPDLLPDVPELLYSIVGDGDEREPLERLVAEVGVEKHVQFRGETTDKELIDSYQQCDVFALPNREVDGDIEGFGMVLLESQACGKPVVAGASGGTAETMRVPETGRIVPCDSPDPLAEVLRELLMDEALRYRMGIAARDWVTSRFGWEALAAEASSVLCQCPRRTV